MTSIVFMPLQIEYNFQQKKEKERKELKANKKNFISLQRERNLSMLSPDWFGKLLDRSTF